MWQTVGTCVQLPTFGMSATVPPCHLGQHPHDVFLDGPDVGLDLQKPRARRVNRKRIPHAALGGAGIAHRHASLCGLGSSADDPNVGCPLGGGLRSDDDLDVLIEAIQESDEPVGREPGDLASIEDRDLRLRQSQ
jgi:hypothetical protein